jgi:energy-coupling factor transport system ATP-binding protein
LAIVFDNVCFAYFENSILEGVVGSFAEERVHLLLGSTGSGKTTLALVMAGLLKPQHGTVLVDGADPASKAFDRRKVQLAFQFPESQIFETTVEREIAYGLRNFGLAGPKAGDRCRWSLDCVGLPEAILPREPNTLSFGERRKVALASVIAIKPKYLILDEPLAGLDWVARRSLVETIGRLRSEELATIVLTHETDLAGEIGDTVAVVGGKGVTPPLPVAEFLHGADGRGEDLLPDFIRILRKVSPAASRTSAAPRRVEDVAAAIASTVKRSRGR